MSLLDIRDNPDYVNANDATKQAIFEQYSAEDRHYTEANDATKAEIRKQFGLSEAAATVAPTVAPPDVTEQATNDLAASAAQTAATAGMSVGETGLGELAQAAKPLVKAAVAGPIAAYAANPLKALAIDAGSALATGGLPLGSAYQSIKAFPEKYQAITEAAKEGSRVVSQGAPDVTGKPISIDPYQNLRDSLRKAGAGELYDDVMKAAHAPGGGGNNAVLSGLQNNQKFQALLTSNPEVASAFKAYSGAVPGVMGQIGRVAGPLLRGAAKVAGPVGMGMNMYDAGQMARETQLGQRLQQGQGQQAEQAFRAGPVQTYQGPQLNTQEQQNVMASGSARDKQYFNDQMNMAIRLKAAKKVLGQP